MNNWNVFVKYAAVNAYSIKSIIQGKMFLSDYDRFLLEMKEVEKKGKEKIKLILENGNV